MPVGTWFGHFFLGLFFVVGFIATADTPWFRHLHPAAQTLINALLALSLQFIMYATPSGHWLYLSLQLFITAYPLIADNLSMPEYTLRWLVLIGFWIWNHPDTLLNGFLDAAVVVIAFILVRVFQKQALYNIWVNLGITFAMSSFFWFTQPHTDWPEQLVYIGLFVCMNLYAALYWTGNHRIAQEHHALAEQVNFDALTHTGSFSMFQRESEDYFYKTKAAKKPLTVITYDIDHFKNINDTYGHLTGDAVLRRITTVVSDVLQSSSIPFGLYRTGGEEFTILLPKQNLDAAMPLAKQCLETVRRGHFEYDSQMIRCTISIGMTTTGPTDATFTQVYNRADHSLYLSKSRGRDCLTVNTRTYVTSKIKNPLLTFALYIQPIVDVHSGEVLAGQLRVRLFDNGRWQMPTDLEITPRSMSHIFKRLVSQTTSRQFIIILGLEQLADGIMLQTISKFIKANPNVTSFAVELAQINDRALFQQVAANGQQLDVGFCLAGGSNGLDYETVKACLPAATSLKYRYQRQDDVKKQAAQQDELKQFKALADSRNIPFIVTGLDTSKDVQLANALHIQYGQGRYFSQSILPRIV